jgi:hypothetical protein
MPALHRTLVVGIFVAISCLASQRARALVVVPPGVNDNTSAPADDPGWANVGSAGVYIGNRWVLTAYHVDTMGALTSINFPGVGAYAVEPGSAVRLDNPSGMGLTAKTDLAMFRLTTAPPLPALSISSTTPAVNATVTMIGNGRSVQPGDAETHWTVTGTDPNFTWTPDPMGDVHGYESGAARKLWGTNLIEDDEPFFTEMDANHTTAVDFGYGHLISLITEFDKSGETNGAATASEAQALGGDSGGGVFLKNGATWELAGIINAIDSFEDQPSASAVYGNLTLSADLSAYRSQILSIAAVPELGGLALVGVAAVVANATCFLRSARRPKCSSAAGAWPVLKSNGV